MMNGYDYLVDSYNRQESSILTMSNECLRTKYMILEENLNDFEYQLKGS